MSVAPRTQYEHRAAALQILYTHECNGAGLESIVSSYSEQEDLTLPEDAFCLKIVKGVLEHQDSLDENIDRLSENWKIQRIELTTKIIIRMAIWEIVHFKTPIKVVIDQALDLSRDFCDKDSYRFVNGLLDNFTRNLQNR